MDILGQSALIVSVTAFSLAITALSRNLRNKLVMAYSAVCAVISVWAFCFFLEKIFATGTFYKFHLTFNLLLAPVGIWFVRALNRVHTGFMRWLYRGSVAYAILVIGLEWAGVEGGLIRSLAYYGPSFLVIACVYFMYLDWLVKRGQINRVKIPTVGLTKRAWIYAGALFLLSTAAMDHVPWLGDVVPSVGNILLCLYLFFLSEAIIHQRLLNISALLNRVLVLVFISLSLTLVYTVFVAWVDNSPALFILNTFLASFVILMLIDPVKKLVELGVVGLFSRRFVEFERKTQEAQAQLVGVLDTTGLAQVTLTFVERTLHCQSASVFVLRSDGTKYRRVRGLHDEGLVNRELLATNPLVEFFHELKKKGEAPVILDQYLINEIDRTASEQQRQGFDLVVAAMRGLNANIAIPFLDGASVLGFVAVQASSPPEPWGNNWGILSVIYPFFVQAAGTLKNMDVYVRLREKDRLAALGEMAAGLAHEIRNPLGAIKGAAQYLQPPSAGAASVAGPAGPAGPAGNAPEAAFLQVIVDETNRLNDVVAQFLDYSRPLTLEFQDYDVGMLLERTVSLFRNGLYARPANGAAPGVKQECGCRIEIVPPAEGFTSLPKLRCVPEQIKQVLVNLIQNSIQSLTETPPPGGGVIKVGAALEHRPRDKQAEVGIFVEDNGKGIAKENLEKIFIPFFTTRAAGTGLGLPICSRIVSAHGGRLDVVSDGGEATGGGKFTRFSVHLPVSLGVE